MAIFIRLYTINILNKLKAGNNIDELE